MPEKPPLDADGRQRLAEEINAVLRESSDPALTVSEIHEQVEFDSTGADVRERVEYLYQQNFLDSKVVGDERVYWYWRPPASPLVESAKDAEQVRVALEGLTVEDVGESGWDRKQRLEEQATRLFEQYREGPEPGAE